MNSSSCSHRKRKRISVPLAVSSLIFMVAPTVDAFYSSQSMQQMHGTPLFATRMRQDTRTTSAVQERDRTFDPVKQREASRQFKPRYVAYEEAKFMGKLLPTVQEIRTANPATLPTISEQLQLTEKITRLLSDESPLVPLGADEQIADKETVFAKLSDEDLRQASDAVSKVTNKGYSELEPVRGGSKKGKVTANVMETGHDTIKQYVKSLANHQVLSPEDEVILGKQIQILARWEEKRLELESSLLRAPTFTEWATHLGTTVIELRTQVRRSQKAKAALVEANLRLVVTVARQTVKKNRSEISFQDACQEGIIGLSRATEKFDPDKGFRFSSYAVWWIRKMIHKNVSEQSRPVRLPASVMKKINDIRIHEKVLQDELGRRPRDHEVAAKVGITVEKLEFYRRALQEVTSLDKKVKFNKAGDNSANDPEVHELVKDPSHSPIELATTQMLKEDVRRLIRTLSPREQAVIRLRFGLDNGTPATLEDIATKFKVEKDQIQKIEVRAIRKLQQPYRNESLKPYIADL